MLNADADIRLSLCFGFSKESPGLVQVSLSFNQSNEIKSDAGELRRKRRRRRREESFLCGGKRS